MGSATIVSRVLGFFRDMLIAALFGSGIHAEALFVALQLPNLARRLLAEGALNAAMVPMYHRLRTERGEAEAARFAGRITGTFTAIVIGSVVLLVMLMPFVVLLLAPGFQFRGEGFAMTVEYARLMSPYLAVAGTVAVLTAVLTAQRRYFASALPPVLFNLCIIGALAAIAMRPRDPSDGWWIALAVGLAGFGQLVVISIALIVARIEVMPLRVDFGRETRTFLALAGPSLIAGSIPQVTLLTAVMIASIQPGAVTWLYYAHRLIEFPLGIIAMIVGTVLVPTFAHAAQSNDHARLRALETRGVELGVGLSLPAAISLALIAPPLTSLLFERGAFSAADTQATAAALAAFALGLPGYVLTKVFSATFFGFGDTKTPMRAALAGLAVSIAGSLATMPLLGHVGVALATTLSGLTSTAVLAVLLARRGFGAYGDALSRLGRITLAAILMGGYVALAMAVLDPALARPSPTLHRMLALGFLIASALTFYAVLLQAFRIVRLRDVIRQLLPKPAEG